MRRDLYGRDPYSGFSPGIGDPRPNVVMAKLHRQFHNSGDNNYSGGNNTSFFGRTSTSSPIDNITNGSVAGGELTNTTTKGDVVEEGTTTRTGCSSAQMEAASAAQAEALRVLEGTVTWSQYTADRKKLLGEGLNNGGI